MTLPNFKLKIVAKQPICEDATAVLKDTANNTILTEAIPSGATENIIAPNATVNLNGSAFISPRSNQTVNVELVDAFDDVPNYTVTGNKIQLTDYDGLPEINLNLNYTGNGSLFDFLT